MKSPGIYRFVIKSNYLNLMLNLEMGDGKKIRELAESVNINYYHLNSVLQAFEEEGIINRDMQQNSYKITLTKKGKALIKDFASIKKTIETWKEEKVEDPVDPKDVRLQEKARNNFERAGKSGHEDEVPEKDIADPEETKAEETAANDEAIQTNKDAEEKAEEIIKDDEPKITPAGGDKNG